MFHKIILTTVSLVVLGIGALGCGSQPAATTAPATNAPAAVQPTTAQVAATSAPTNAPAAANPTQAAPASPRPLYACSLLSQAEAEAIMGKALENIPFEPQSGSEDIQSICKYQVKDAPASTAALSVVRYPDADNAHKGMEENKDFMLTVFKAKAENLSGLGDEAFWAGEAPKRHLNVRQNDFILELGFTQAQDAQVEQLAKKMLGHLDDVFIVPPANVTTAQEQPTSAPTTQAAAQPTAKPTDGPVAAAGTGDACAIFRQDEVESLLGKKVKPQPQASADPVQGSKVSTCSYQVEDSLLDGAQLVLHEYDSPDKAKAVYAQVMAEGVQQFQIIPDAVSGIGDEAHWIGMLSWLNVRQGKYILILMLTDETRPDAKLQTFVNTILKRLSPNQSSNPAPTQATNSGGASASFDGTWKGETTMKRLDGKNIPFTFIVANNKISQVTQDFRVPSGVCEGFSGSGNDHPNAPIQNNAFTVKWENKLSAKSVNKAEITGAFQSPTQASGTMHFSGTSSFCGEYDFEATWTASK